MERSREFSSSLRQKSRCLIKALRKTDSIRMSYPSKREVINASISGLASWAGAQRPFFWPSYVRLVTGRNGISSNSSSSLISRTCCVAAPWNFIWAELLEDRVSGVMGSGDALGSHPMAKADEGNILYFVFSAWNGVTSSYSAKESSTRGLRLENPLRRL